MAFPTSLVVESGSQKRKAGLYGADSFGIKSYINVNEGAKKLYFLLN